MVPAALLAGLLAALSLSACSVGGTDQQGVIVGSGDVVMYPPGQRHGVVHLSGTTLDGKSYRLDGSAAATVVNVWWSDCGPCIKEAPLLRDASQRWGNAVGFVGVATRDASENSARAFEQKYGLRYPSLWSPDGSALLGFPSQYTLSTIPETAVLDKDHRVAAIIHGEIPSQLTLDEVVRCVIHPRGPHCYS